MAALEGCAGLLSGEVEQLMRRYEVVNTFTFLAKGFKVFFFTATTFYLFGLSKLLDHIVNYFPALSDALMPSEVYLVLTLGLFSAGFLCYSLYDLVEACKAVYRK